LTNRSAPASRPWTNPTFVTTNMRPGCRAIKVLRVRSLSP
jgi:hypothetical protein